MPKKQKSKLRQEARNRECQIKVPFHCNCDKETVVLCHIHKPSISGGLGVKARDEFGAWGCSGCHDVVDGRVSTEWGVDQLIIWFYEAVFRTQNILLKEEKL